MRSKTQKSITDMFVAVDEEGDSYAIQEITPETSYTLMSGKSSTVKGLREYSLHNGDRVNKISDGVYELVLSGKTLKRQGQ